MDFRLVESRWDDELQNAAKEGMSPFCIICPFIKKSTISKLLNCGNPDVMQVITRFNLNEFAAGVSDIEALRLMLDKGAQIRGVRNLHSKLYLFGQTRVILTSANLTNAALTRNHEFGFVSADLGIISHCHQYFDNLWSCAGSNLTSDLLSEWQNKVSCHLASGVKPKGTCSLGDFGSDAGLAAAPRVLAPAIADASQAFVKFFGESDNRAEWSMQIQEEVERSGCHWACTYPQGKRPRQTRDGDIMFLSRMVQNPDDIIVFGRAIGMQHRHSEDDATDEDIKQRPWKTKWPHYIRVHHAEFIAGTLANGVSLYALMDALGSDAFAPTQRNAAKKHGNTNPHRAYLQQAAVQLSPQGKDFLIEQFEAAATRFGKLAPTVLAALDWPS